LFWQYDFESLSVERDRTLIVRRLVEKANGEELAWLRSTYGDEIIREEIVAIKARGLPYKRVRRWISLKQYARWTSERPPSIWDARSSGSAH